MFQIIFWGSRRPKNWTQALVSRSWIFWIYPWVRHQGKLESRVLPRSKRTNEMPAHIQLDSMLSGTSLPSVFLSGPQEETDDGRPLLSCKEETHKAEHLLLEAKLINIVIENLFFPLLWSPCFWMTFPSPDRKFNLFWQKWFFYWLDSPTPKKDMLNILKPNNWK